MIKNDTLKCHHGEQCLVILVPGMDELATQLGVVTVLEFGRPEHGSDYFFVPQLCSYHEGIVILLIFSGIN